MQDVDKDLDFTNLEPTEIPIPYGSNIYYLRESTEDTNKQYRSRAMKCYGTDGAIKNPDMVAETPQWFVGQCLFTEPGGDVTKRVKSDIIKSMPTRIVSRLFAKVRKISGMEGDEDTVESLTKQIAELTKRLEELQAREASGESNPT